MVFGISLALFLKFDTQETSPAVIAAPSAPRAPVAHTVPALMASAPEAALTAAIGTVASPLKLS